MTEHYKLYCLDAAGRIMRPGWVEAANDQEAIAKAGQQHPEGRCELWLLGRHVADLSDGQTSPASGRSHEFTC